ncbi:Carbohydrate family 9 binding domain-like [bacterium JGI 053]|nr:Carbohydrate family 9 binding domain-like [bacterium JGI 053]
MTSPPPARRTLVRAAALFLALAAAPATAQTATPATATQAAHGTAPTLQAVARTAPIRLDGVLDEAVWSSAPAATGFRQRDPDEGRPATQRTEVRFAWDADALYVGARMYDSLGAAGVRTSLTRRDQTRNGDWLEIDFDTYHDHSGITVFQINPSGVKYDAGQASPNADVSWDPVWQAAARVDSLGWTAELRIPWSQLKFSRDSLQTWGLQVTRFEERLNELSVWSFWPKRESGGPVRFGHLAGLGIGRSPGGWELMPYAVGRASYVRPTQPGSPFQDPSAYNVRVGADVKALLGSNLTLSATINPDFGQVEVDPAVVNLSAYETSFAEKRPFFVEGSGLLGFGSLNCFTCSNVSSTSLFYSRRIGRSPQGALPFSTRYVNRPESSPILGAAKLTGRFRSGLEVGVLDALTGAGRADIIGMDGGALTREVEPLTNYFVGRVRRTYPGGNVTVGAIGTSVVRSFGYDSLRDQLSSRAEALGLDWNLWWKNHTYRLMGNFALSSVEGDSLAIGRLQRSSARYFQRPDREQGSNALFSNAYDPSATALRGFGGYMRMAKEAGTLRWETQLNVRSPGFEVNDLAFLTRADYVWALANVNGYWTKPTRWYRSLWVTAGAQRQQTFSGDVNDGQLHLSTSATLPNYWGVNSYLQYRPEVYDERLTRGGAIVRRAAQQYVSFGVNTDARKPLVLGTSPSYGHRADGGWDFGEFLDLRYRPTASVSLQATPSYSRSVVAAQYVTAFTDPAATAFFGRRAVFGRLDQTTLSMDMRVNVTFTPDLSLELFAQPFVSSGEYADFKEFTRPRALEKTLFGADRLTAVKASGGRDSLYLLDADRDPATGALSFRNPDFNFRSLRGSAVLRWEYRPGSTLFFVWQQQRSGQEPFGDFALSRDAGAVFREHPDNVFVIKASYWIGR